ncbi:hypothetical protein D3C78_1643300 [compost metagenome]
MAIRLVAGKVAQQDLGISHVDQVVLGCGLQYFQVLLMGVHAVQVILNQRFH